jgi:hypothetical protein
VDIINTLPVEPAAAAFQSAYQDQIDYSLALAVISQLALNRNETLSSTLANIANNLSSSGFKPQMAASIQTAVDNFMANSNNKTGITDKQTTNLPGIGGTTSSYKLAIQSSGSTAAIMGIQFEMVIPAGLTIRTDSSGAATSDVITLASAAIPSMQFMTRYSAIEGVLYVVIASDPKNSISAGDLATISYDVLYGWTTPAASAFQIRNIKAVDAKAATISGVTVTVN